MHDAAGLGVENRVIEPVVVPFLNKTDDHGGWTRCLDQFAKQWGIGRQRYLRHHIAEKVAGERQLGEDNEIGPLLASLIDLFQVPTMIAGAIAQSRRHLHQRRPDR
jgi:hypothetical protein